MRARNRDNQADTGFCRCWLLRCQWRHMTWMAVVIFALFSSPATAQYPGSSSDASLGSVSTDDDSASASSLDSGGDSQNGKSASGKAASDVASDVASDYGRNDGAAGSAAVSDGDNNLAWSKNRLQSAARQKTRQRYFVRKLWLEFAGMELIERKTGLPFSRDDVPRYLSELRAELAMMGAADALALQSLAGDARHIETETNQHIDQLLEMIEAPKNGSSGLANGFFAPSPPLAKTVNTVTAKMAALSLKYELMEYGERALQAMGVRP